MTDAAETFFPTSPPGEPAAIDLLACAPGAARLSPGQMIRRASRLLTATIDTELLPTGMNVSQWLTLKMAHATDGVPVQELARDVDVAGASMTRLLDGLEARALVRRIRSDADRRIIRIEVTSAGHALLAEATPRVSASLSALFSTLDAPETAQLLHLLGKFLSAFDRTGAAGTFFQAETVE